MAVGRCAALALSSLLAGCSGVQLEVLPLTELPSYDCDDPELRDTVAPLRVRVSDESGAPLRKVEVVLAPTPAQYVDVLEQRSIEAVAVPSDDFWLPQFDDGDVWAQFTGSTGLEAFGPLTGATTDQNGAIQLFVHVALRDVCEDGAQLDEAGVDVSAEGEAAQFVLTYGGGA